MVIRIQEKYKAKQEHVKAANEWTLRAHDCFQNLERIKNYYVDTLTDEPLDRLAIPFIPVNYPPVEVNITNLAFITPKKIEDSEDLSFDHIGTISHLMKNYNDVLNQWTQRNSMVEPLREKIVTDHHSGGNQALVQYHQILDSIGEIKLTTLINLTESVIENTDMVLQELTNFLAQFPEIVKFSLKKYSGWNSVFKNYEFRPNLLSIKLKPDKLARTLKTVSVDPTKLKKYSSSVSSKP